ncbi:MAG TPA: methyltransferase domain-containing protein [Gammaproteobacteria bacterium]|nr:methyltransferase domain-containing protein [Gammaproteobacteria bacterium]
MLNIKSALKRYIKRLTNKPDWHNLRSTSPISKVFGLDRGTPIDRVYIEHFLKENSSLIGGVVLEIAENTYSKKYGVGVEKYEILHATPDNKDATIIGDLTNPDSLPDNAVDCFICTQTFNFIYDFKAAIRGAYRLLKPGGTLLATASGLSQISRYDMDRWGDYWRFTDLSARKSFGEVFGEENVSVTVYGNVLSCVAFLEGISAEEITEAELFHRDPDYQMTIVIKATKPMADASSSMQ